MTAAVRVMWLTWHWLKEYARRPLHVALAVAVPILLVTLTAGTLADFAVLLGASGGTMTADVATAGWSAAVLTGVAGFFQVSGSRAADRRLASANGQVWTVVASRLLSTAGIAALAVLGALAALRLRTESATSARVIGATVLFAVIYLGVGVLLGALVKSDLNGSLIIVFLWVFDVFYGPAMRADATFTRILPLHFPTEVAIGEVSGHAAPIGSLGAALMWAAASLVAAVIALAATTRPRQRPPTPRFSRLRRLRAGGTAAFRELRRMPALWILVVILPVAFISAAGAATPPDPTPVRLTEGGVQSLQLLLMSDVHAADMVPITIAILSSLAGLFVVLDAAQGDRRLALSEFRSGELLSVRTVAVLAAALSATAVSIAVTAFSFSPKNWPAFVGANIIIALTYALIGIIVGSVFGRLGGLYILLIVPFLDLGIAQNAMFGAVPPPWARFLPGHGAMRVMIDGAFTPTFDEFGGLWLAVGWLVALGATASIAFQRLAGTSRTPRE